LWSFRAEAAATGAGRGGPYFEFHTGSLAAFDPTISGNAFVVGGVGYGAAGKTFRLGGAGGGGFLWDSSVDVDFGMGYGGVIGEYVVTKWLNVQMIIGGGGYSIAKVTEQTETTTTLEKISSGGFVLFYPSITFEVNIKKFLTLAGKVGYFLPDDSRLHTLTLGMSLMLGKM